MIKNLIRTSRNKFSTLKANLRDKDVINPHIQMYRLSTDNTPNKLYTILHQISHLDVNITNIESNYALGNPSRIDIDIFIDPNNNEINETQLKTLLMSENAAITTLEEQVLPNFPISLNDLDDMEAEIQILEDGFNQDHPQYTDQDYRRRRDEIANMSKGVKFRDSIPRIAYTDQETQLWSFLFTTLKPKLYEHGCEAYTRNLRLLEDDGVFTADAVPQLEDIDKYLKSKTNWRIKPVNGILSQRQYLNCLAFRTFCSTQYIRNPSQPFYTPEPDIMHEFLGHIPNFCDPVFCDISQKIGIMSLGASDRLIKLIGSVYWYTVEFGLCKENGKMKFYGGGIASSVKEIEHCVTTDKLRKLDLSKEYPDTQLIAQDIQPFYYYIERFEECLEQLNAFESQIKKPFKYRFDEKVETLFIDRRIRVLDGV